MVTVDRVPTTSRLDMWRNKVEYQGVVLGMICVSVTLLLLLGSRLTTNDIEKRVAEDRMLVFNQVLPQERYDNDPLTTVVRIDEAGIRNGDVDVYVAKYHGKFVGAVFQTETNGYGGPISLILGIDADGAITGVRVLAHRETPGLADKIEIRRSQWITAFDGRSLENTEQPRWAVKKYGGEFDQFTGATITPRAIVNGVYEGLLFYSRHQTAIHSVSQASKEE